jgi:hypothetical protein
LRQFYSVFLTGIEYTVLMPVRSDEIFQRNGTYYYRRRVPQALIDLGYPRKEEKKSLKTDDPGIAETLWTKHNTVVEAKWDQWRRGLQVLTPRKREALAGEIYRRVLRENQFPYFCGGIGTALKLGVAREWDGDTERTMTPWDKRTYDE